MNIEVVAAGNTNVVRAKPDVMKDLKIKGGIEDILITLTDQYHLIRTLASAENLLSTSPSNGPRPIWGWPVTNWPKLLMV